MIKKNSLVNYLWFCLILITATAIPVAGAYDSFFYLSPRTGIHSAGFFSTDAVVDAVMELKRTNPELKTPDLINYAQILVVLKEYFRNDFSGRRGMELGITSQTMNLFRYLQKNGCHMRGAGYDAPTGENFTHDGIDNYLKTLAGKGEYDFIYARQVLTTPSSFRNSLELFVKIYEGIHSNLKNGGYFITIDDFSEVLDRKMSLPTETIVNLGFEIVDEFYISGISVVERDSSSIPMRLMIFRKTGAFPFQGLSTEAQILSSL